MTAQDAIDALWAASIATPIDLKTNGARDIAVALICRERTHFAA